MFRARLAVLLLVSAGLSGCVTYHCPPDDMFGCCGFAPQCVPAPACGCNGAPPVAYGEGPLLESNGPVPIGPPMNGNGGLMPPGRLRPQPLAQPLPSPP